MTSHDLARFLALLDEVRFPDLQTLDDEALSRAAALMHHWGELGRHETAKRRHGFVQQVRAAE